MVKIDFEVPNYPNALASFEIYKSDTALTDKYFDPVNSKSGILVSSGTTVFEIGSCSAAGPLFSRDLKGLHPFKYIFGTLRCDYIDTLAREICTNGKSTDNPFLVFDPNRRGGLNKDHPFVKSLYEIPYRWLDTVLNKLDDMYDSETTNGEMLSELFGHLEQYLNNTLAEETFLYTWRTKKDTENITSNRDLIKNIDVNQDLLDIPPEFINPPAEDEPEDMIRVPKIRHTKYEFQMVSGDTNLAAYELQYFSDKIVIKVNADDPTLNPYVKINETYGISDGRKDKERRRGSFRNVVRRYRVNCS